VTRYIPIQGIGTSICWFQNVSCCYLPVDFEGLKAINVKHSYQASCIWILTNWHVYLIHNPAIFQFIRPINLPTRNTGTTRNGNWKQSRLTTNLIKFVFWSKFFSYQSNSLEYTVFANASRLKVANSGSRGFVMFPSGVTMTRLQRESSKAFSLHLNNTIVKDHGLPSLENRVRKSSVGTSTCKVSWH